MLVGPLEVIVGREARANPVAQDAAAGLLTPHSETRAAREEVRKVAKQDGDYLKYLALNIDSVEQFDDAMTQVKGNMQEAVKGMILPLLPMHIQTAIRQREVLSES